MQTAYMLVSILICEMFHGYPKWSVKSTFMNSVAILWQIRRIYCECFEKNSSKLSLNSILRYLKIYIINPHF